MDDIPKRSVGLALIALLIPALIPYRTSYSRNYPDTRLAEPLEIPPEATERPLRDETVEVEESTATTSIYCSCIKTARSLCANIPPGTNAWDIEPNTTPAVGVLALFSYPKADHVACVVYIGQHGFSVVEGNYERCEITRRFIEWDDPSLRGFARY
jgi:hypothetical protein